MNDDYFVREIDLPLKVRGVTTPNDDGTYSIYINRNLSYDQKLKTLDHEIGHIELNHFASDKAVDELETEANNYVPKERRTLG